MALKISLPASFLAFLLLSFTAGCSALSHSNALHSGGSESQVWHSKWEYLKSLSGATSLHVELESCEENYGFFPCSTTFGGNLFLLLVYGYLLLVAAQCLSEGSELLLTVLNPGIIGGLLLPILGALPDALLILVSGLSASTEEAQSEVLVGMGLLAGSTIMLLTALWGSALLVGRCDLVVTRGQLMAKDRTLTKGWSLTGTGVTTDQQTRVASWIMIVTVLPYLLAQAPVVFGWSEKAGRLFVLVGCVISVIGLASYCMYQVAYPWIQQRRIFTAKQKLHRSKLLHRMSQLSEENAWGNLLESDGTTPNKKVLQRLFVHFDQDKDGYLSEWELRGLITGLGIEHEGRIPEEEQILTWMKDFDISNDSKISCDEFVQGMMKWMHGFDLKKRPKRTVSTIKKIEESAISNGSGHNSSHGHNDPGPHIFWSSHSYDAQMYLTTLLQDQTEEEEEEEESNNPPTKGQVITKAVGYLIIGALIAGIVADPLVDAIGNFSTVTGISPFFISFVATPLATNSSEAISSLLFAMRKRRKNISMTYSQIYGGVTMNNTLCLAIFLAIVYYRGLTWDFSSEVLVILVATVVIGALASVRITFPSWMAIIALVLYPFSIALVAILDYVYGWQ